MQPSHRIRQEMERMWSASRPLTAAAGLMLAALAVFGAGLLLDARLVAGMPAWLKPAKFAASTAILCGTLAWLYRYITVWPRFVRAMGTVVAAVVLIEVGIIALQSARGTTSHFNVATTFDFVMWAIMGTAILVLWLALAGITAALFRQKFAVPAWGWWLRLGLLITLIGSASGGLMVRPTPEQARTIDAGGAVTTVGAHSVGGPDGGRGLPVVGWSTEHGDLRVAHFLSLHGLQALPLLGALALGRRGTRSGRDQVRLAFATAGSYAGLVLLLTVQALGGQSVAAPDTGTLAALALWLAFTAVAILRPIRSARERTVAAAGTGR